MTFQNLPIGLEAARNADPGDPSGAPFSYAVNRSGPGRTLLDAITRRNTESADSSADPFRRIGGGIAFHCDIDLENRKVTDVASMATLFRGYEALLLKRDLREAGLISSTASGICGGVHATTSAQCLEMALGVKPPPFGVVARNLLLSCQYLNDNPMHLFILSGPDYSEETFRATNPEIWEKAENAPARLVDIHGYATIGALMVDLNRGSGALFREALMMMRQARSAYAVLGGKYPHSESIIPGGVSLSLGAEQLDGFAEKIAPFNDYAKRCAAIWDEIFDFLLEQNPRYRDLGRGPATMVDFGQWDHDGHYDASYANCDSWGEARWSTPGAIVGGTLATTRLSELNIGIEEFVDHSFHDPWRGHAHRADPLGNPLSPYHPWNKTVHQNPNKDPASRPYSWPTTTAWDRNVFEVGAYARLYISALARKLPATDFIESTGASLAFNVPAGDLPAQRLEWRVPAVWNAFERNRARAHAVAFNLTVTLENLKRARDLLAAGETETATAFEIPAAGERFGVGFGGAGRGFLAHWAVLTDGVLSNYQISIPSRVNAGPRAPWGQPGAVEQAVLETPIIESNWTNETDFHGIDIVRAMQSFDPCMPCQAHMFFEDSEHQSSQEVTNDGII